MIDDMSDRLDHPLAVAANLLRLKPFSSRRAESQAEKAMRHGAVTIRALYDENEKLKKLCEKA